MMVEIKRLLALREFVLVKLSQNQNRVADNLVNLGRSGGRTAWWLHMSRCVFQNLY